MNFINENSGCLSVLLTFVYVIGTLLILVVPAKQCRFENTHLYCFVNT